MTTIVRDRMTHQPATIDKQVSIAEAAARMEENHVRHLPVTDEGVLVGIVSQRDLAVFATIPGVHTSKVPIEHAMTPNPYSCSPETPLWEVVETMAKKRIGAAVVMDRGEVAGVFTTTDALTSLAERLAD